MVVERRAVSHPVVTVTHPTISTRKFRALLFLLGFYSIPSPIVLATRSAVLRLIS